ncbi:MAG: UPF0164 family protein [Candidatus Wallbacteria bacterium]|nr:UPF0164 family protein [Candidatus Wallbacteria bacterium]
MTKTCKTIIIGLALLLAALPVGAEDSSGSAGAYLKMGVGARPLGMGGAFTAIADDATAAFWNPAGLVQLDKKEITTMHAMLKMDRTYNFLNYIQPLPKRNAAWGVNYVRFGVDDLPETHIWRRDNLGALTRGLVYGTAVTSTDGRVIPVLSGDDSAANGFVNFTANYPGGFTYNEWKAWMDARGIQNIEVFSQFEDTEWTMSLSYAQKLKNERVMLGGNLKYLRQDLFDYSADSFALDMGMLCIANPRFNWGISLRDLGANLKWDTPSGRKDRVPLTSTLGMAYFPNPKLNVALDFTSIQDGENMLHFGVEGYIREKFGVRGGIDDGDLTLGASFKNDAWRFDYAFRDQELGNEHRLSAGYQF